MRHRKSFNHLGRTSSHRNAMLANMAASLILHKRIETTTAKAKALRSYLEPLITKSKEDTTHSRRVIFSYLQNKEAVAELFREVAVKVHDRPGGYTRVLKLGTRLGDSAEMCIIELVDFNENLLGDVTTKAKPGRKRRGSKKKDQEKAVPTVGAPATKEEKSADVEEQVAAETEMVEETVIAAEAEDNAATGEEAASESGDEPERVTHEESSPVEDKTEPQAEEAPDEPEEDKTDLK